MRLIADQVADISVADQVDLVLGGQQEAQGGSSRASRLMREVYEELPEGATVAQALEEITFRLRAEGGEQ